MQRILFEKIKVVHGVSRSNPSRSVCGGVTGRGQLWLLQLCEGRQAHCMTEARQAHCMTAARQAHCMTEARQAHETLGKYLVAAIADAVARRWRR